MFQDEGSGTGEIAHQRNPADVFQIPDKVDFLHAHNGHASSGTDDEQAAACSGAVGNEAPKIVIHRKDLQIVHPHRGSH